MLTEIVRSSAGPLPAHDHQAAHVGLLLRGDYRERVGTRTIELAPRHAVYHPPAFRHRDEIGVGGAAFLVVELAGSLAARAAEALPREPVLDQRGEMAALLGRLHLEMDADDPAAPLVREGLALELFGAVARRAADRGVPGWVARADSLLRERPAERWSLPGLAAEVGVSAVRLTRGFRRAFGESVGERLRRARLEAARERLARSGSDLSEVAYACGFADQSHLTRAFRRVYGVTPGAFRSAAVSSA